MVYNPLISNTAAQPWDIWDIFPAKLIPYSINVVNLHWAGSVCSNLNIAFKFENNLKS